MTTMKKLFLTGIAVLFLATGTAHAGEFPKHQIWQCDDASYIVVNPVDLVWEYNRADFVRGYDRFTIWHNHLYQRYSVQGRLQDIPCQLVMEKRNFPARNYVYLSGLPLVF